MAWLIRIMDVAGRRGRGFALGGGGRWEFSGSAAFNDSLDFVELFVAKATQLLFLQLCLNSC
jgi:hypothetical protein